MRLSLAIWRQDGPAETGRLVDYSVDVEPALSFLDMLDELNEALIRRGERVIEFDHDCREGICGACGVLINGRPHGPLPGTTTCQLHVRAFADGDRLTIEPFRASAFPVICDLKVDRSALDRVLRAGGYISTNVGAAPEANSVPIAREVAEAAFAMAACLGCGACVASCKNASAALFTGAKVSHLAQLPQGKLEASRRVLSMVKAMDGEGFGHCSNTTACEAVCPQEISTDAIARLNWEYNLARLRLLLR
jgi:succinate dehydrogenase / fumarate reductase iron-sulfur subunit